VIASSRPAPGGATGPVLRRVLANAGKLLGGRAVNAGVSLAYTAVAARALGVQTFGILVLIHAFAQLIGDVVKFQSWQTVLQYGAPALTEGRRGDLHRVLRFTVMLDVVSGVVGALTGVGVALAFGAHLGWTAAQGPAAAGYATSVIFMTAAAPLGVLRLLDRFDLLVPVVLAVGLFFWGRWLGANHPELGTNGPQLLVWGFFVSTVVLFHVTVTINSLAHRFGSRRFATRDNSRNNWLLAILTFGEGWHNNHHHFPGSARQGFRWWEVDITFYLLRTLSLFGVVHGLRAVPAGLKRSSRR